MWIFFGQAVLIVDTVMVGSTMTATETHQVDCIIGNYPFYISLKYSKLSRIRLFLHRVSPRFTLILTFVNIILEFC